MAGEQDHGVAPVPPEARTRTWLDLSAMTTAFLLNPLMYVLGALAVTKGGLPLVWAVAALVSGQFASYALIGIVGRLGVDHGLAGQVGMRAFYGYWGARILTSGYRTIVTSYWFAAQAIAAAFGIQALLAGIAGWHLRIVPTALVLAAVEVAIAVLGFDVLRYLTRVVLPLSIGFVVLIVAFYFNSDDPRFAVGHVFHSPAQHFNWTGFATFFTVVVGSTFTFTASASDFTQYTRSRRDMWIAFMGVAAFMTGVTTFVGGYAAVATGDGNPFKAATQITGSKFVLVLLLVAIVVQSLGVNVINSYTVGLSLLSSVPRLGRLRATLAGGIAGIALSAFPAFVTDAQRWIGHLSNLAFPLTGVIVADLLWRQHGTVDVAALYESQGRYRYVRGVNVAAVGAIGVAMIVYYLVPDSWVKALWGTAIGAFLYLPLARAQDAALARGRLTPEPVV